MIGYHGKGGKHRPGVDHTDLGLKYEGLLCVRVLVDMCVFCQAVFFGIQTGQLK